MQYVDKVSIDVLSGHGGAGAVSFRREKFVPFGGPDGGHGGRGGHVILRASRTLQTLMDLKIRRKYKAKAGNAGQRRKMAGASGKDTVIVIPVGTMIFDETGGLLADLTKDGQDYVAAKGGKGGAGNSVFANSVNQTPRYAQPGLPGEERKLTLEIRMLAEVGLIGLPNAGKSTLLQVLTQANPKISDYPFTTLYPNLGLLKFVDQEIVIADIPGLIEGASEGLGLGHDFLRHIDRTQVIVHVISAETLDADTCYANYKTVLSELEKSDHDFQQKRQLIVLSKKDTCHDEETCELFLSELKTLGLKPDIFVSGLTRDGIPDLITAISARLQESKNDRNP